MDLASYAESILEEVVKAEGFNVGWNVGAASGAGVTNYLHLHIVPRWNGDHNYMSVLCGTRIIPMGLTPLYEKLLAATERVSFASKGYAKAPAFAPFCVGKSRR